MADISDSSGKTVSTDAPITYGELKSLLLGLKTGEKETKGSPGGDFSELKSLLESTFKDFNKEIEKLNSNMEKSNAIARKKGKRKSKDGSGGDGGTGPSGKSEEELAKDAVNDAKELAEKRKRIAERELNYQINKAQKALTDISGMSNTLFVGVDDAYGKLFKGIIADERQFIIGQKEIAYETEGALISNTKLMSSYTDLEKTVNKTGVSRTEFQKNYANAIKSGNRDLKVAKALTTAQLNTERQLGIEVGGLSDVFQRLNTQFGMSEMQIAEMGRGMREVAKSSGLTGSSLKKAVESSTQFMEMMRNAGQLTSLAAKNIQSIAASAQKFGIEKELSPLVQALSSSSNLIMESSEQTKNLLFIAANKVGRVSDVLNGTILKTKQGTKDIAQGLRKVLSDFGVQSLEAIDNLTDQEKFRINLTLKSAFGIEVDQAKRQIMALEEGSKTYAEKLADLNKEMKKNLTMEEKAIIREKERSIKLSASLGLLTALDEASKNASNMGEAYSNFNAKAANYADELNALGLTAKSEKDVAKGAFLSAITNINKSLQTSGKKTLNISSSEIEKAINNPEAMRQLSAKLSAAEQEAATAAKAQLDPAKNMEQTLMELNEGFRGFSNKVLAYLAASAIGNIIANLGTGLSIAATGIGKIVGLYTEMRSGFRGLQKLPEKISEWWKSKKGSTDLSNKSMLPESDKPNPPNKAEIETASAVKKGKEKGSFYTHDIHCEKVLDNVLKSLRSSNQIIHKIATKCCGAGVGAASGKGPKSIAEQKAMGQMKYAQYEGDPAAKALQKSKDRHERKTMKDEKWINKNQMKNTKDDKIINKQQKSNIKNQGGFEIMGFDVSALTGQGTNMMKAAPALMILGLGALLLGSALIWICNKIIKALGIDLSTVLETAAVVAAVVGVTAALMMAVSESKDALGDKQFKNFNSTAKNLSKNIRGAMFPLIGLGISMVLLGAGLIWISDKILGILGLDNQKIIETAETVGVLIGGFALIAGAVATAAYGLKMLQKYMPFNQIGSIAKEIFFGALTLTILLVPMLFLATVLMKFCSWVLSAMAVNTQTIKETVETVTVLMLGLGAISLGVGLAVAGLFALGAGAAALMLDPLTAALVIALIYMGAEALIYLTAPMILAASALMKFCNMMLSATGTNTEDIKKTVETVSTLMGGLALISTSVGIAALGLAALGAGTAAALIFGGVGLAMFVGLIATGTVALSLLSGYMINAAKVVLDFCSSVMSSAGVNSSDIKNTVELINNLFDGLNDIIQGLVKASLYLSALANPAVMLALFFGFFIVLPIFTDFVKGVNPLLVDFVKTLVNLVATISKNVGGIGNIEFVRKFSEEMCKAINAIVDMLRTLGTALNQLAGKSFYFFGSSIIDNILAYSKDFTSAMKVICENVIREGIIDPILDNFNRSGVKKTKYAMAVAELIGKAVTSVANMLVTFGDIVKHFNKRVSKGWFSSQTVIEQIKDLGISFSKHFKTITKTINDGIITPIIEQFRNLKPIDHAARAAKGLGIVISSVADMLNVLNEKIKPLTEKGIIARLFTGSQIEQIESSLKDLSEPLRRIFTVLSDEVVPAISMGNNTTKKLQAVMPALDMFSKILTFISVMMDGMKKLQERTVKKRDYSGNFLALIPVVGMMTTHKSEADKAAEGANDMAKAMTGIMNGLSSVIDAMEKASKTNGKDSKRMENALKSFEQISNITSKLSKLVEDYLKSSQASKKIKAEKGGYDEATKSIQTVTEESNKLVVQIMKSLGTEKQFNEIKNATSLINALTSFLGEIIKMVDNFSEVTETVQSLKKTMLKVGRENGAVTKEINNEKKTIHETLNLDDFAKFIKLYFKSVIENSTSIFNILKGQQLPDVKGMMAELNKLMILIQAIRAMGMMMTILEQVYTAQESLNVQLGGGVITKEGKKVDRGNQIRQIGIHMGEKIKSVVELGVGIIEQIQGAKIGNLKGVEESLSKLVLLVKAVKAIQILMTLFTGDGKNTGLIDIAKGLNDQLKQLPEEKGNSIDSNAVKNINTTLGDNYITPILDLSEAMITSIGGKLKDISPDHVKKLMNVADMLTMLKKIIVSLKDMFLDKTETIPADKKDDKNGMLSSFTNSFGKKEEKATMIQALAKEKDSFIKYFEELGNLFSGMIAAVETSFIDPSQIEGVKNKILATVEVTDNLSTLLGKINQDMNKIYKDYRTYGINTYIGFKQDDPMKNMGEGVSIYLVEHIMENFTGQQCWDTAVELVGFAVTGLNRLVYDLERINISVDTIMRNYKGSKGIDDLKAHAPMEYIGRVLWNHLYVRVVDNFPKQAHWSESLDRVKLAQESTDSMNDMLDDINHNIEEIIISSNGIAASNSSDIIREAAESIQSNVIDPINQYMPSLSSIGEAVFKIDMVTKGIVMISESLRIMSESLQEIGSLNIENALGDMSSGFSNLAELDGVSLSPENSISSMFTGNINPETEVRKEKATVETSVNLKSSLDALASINQEQLKTQNEMRDLLREIRDNTSELVEPEGEIFAGDTLGETEKEELDTSSKTTRRKPILGFNYPAGQFHSGTGSGIEDLGVA